MVFCSISFLLYFLPAFLMIYLVAPDRMRNLVLFTASIVFYAMGEPQYVPHILASVLVNYCLGRLLGLNGYCRAHRKKRRYRIAQTLIGLLFWLAVAGNVGMLLWYKAVRFGNAVPLGMSFYTFQILSYLIDVYRGEVDSEASPVRFAVYVTMFPRLTAGPIVRYDEVAAALKKRHISFKTIRWGLRTFTLGLAAKVLLADRIGMLWNHIQVIGIESVSTPLAWLGAFSYSLQLYFDFWGYSVMAVGLGAVMGFSLPDNFRDPYMARSVREFYRRWHITLGRWFRKYIYIPLGGNRNGGFGTARNLLIVWALTGLWHGGRENYILWGIVIWGLIVLERLGAEWFERHPVGGGSLLGQLTLLPHLYLWLVIPVTWVIFAIPDVREMGLYLGRMFGVQPQSAFRANDWKEALAAYGGLFAVCFAACTPWLRAVYYRIRNWFAVDVAISALFWFCAWEILRSGGNPFLYLRF